jgi:Domain of unknown function (DUF4440)
MLTGFINRREEVMQKSISSCVVGMFGFLAIGLALLTLTSCQEKNDITQDELLRRTQTLFDSVAAGDQTLWKRYFAEDCMYFDEKGRSMNKAARVADISPLPPGYSGGIKLGKAQSHIEGDVAILSYDLDEKEAIYGHNMTARYHARYLDATQRAIANSCGSGPQVLRRPCAREDR